MATDLREGRTVPGDVEEFLDARVATMVIDGQDVGDGAGEVESLDPATEDVLAVVPEADEATVDRAVMAARRAFQERRWTSIPPADRAKLLFDVGQRIDAAASDLAWIETLDHGKPVGHAKAEIRAAANCFRYFAGWVDKVYGDTIPSRDGRFVYSRRQPVGVCGQIIPWNFPFLMATWKIAPALAFGNTVVLKPAEQTPLSARWLLRILADAGVPDGVVNLVQGRGETTGEALVAHPEVDKVAFTGSTEVGKLIMRESAEHLHKVTLELGGKSPNVIFADAPGGAAKVAARGAFACFYNAGEVCTAGTRLLVEESFHDELMERLVQAAEQTTVGPGWQRDSAMGPVVTAEQRERVMGHVAAAREDGAELVTGGGGVEEYDAGFWVAPTIFDGVTSDMRLAQEEVFGPVLAVQTFADEQEAIALANDVRYGLAAGIWTSDLGRAHRVAEGIDAGTVWVNTYGELDSPVSFGGFKQSGMGRELGPHAVEAYTQVKSVWVSTK